MGKSKNECGCRASARCPTVSVTHGLLTRRMASRPIVSLFRFTFITVHSSEEVTLQYRCDDRTAGQELGLV